MFLGGGNILGKQGIDVLLELNPLIEKCWGSSKVRFHPFCSTHGNSFFRYRDS